MTRPQRTPTWMRLAALVIGAGLLVWLPFEDTGLWFVLVFAGMICAWLAARLMLILKLTGGRGLLLYLLAGTLAGLMVAPVALLLMAFKSGLHGHGAPDFTPAQVQAVLLHSPAWGGSGLLLGLGCGLLRIADF
jgi:hypothetical protein